MGLNIRDESHRIQLEHQLASHKHETYKTDIKLGEAEWLRDFTIYKDVFRSDVMGSRYLAEYLYANRERFQAESGLDMGCGAGLQGVTLRKHSVQKIMLTDKFTLPLANTMENIMNYALDHFTLVQSDLFENIPKQKFDIIVFNHPFFLYPSIQDIPVSSSMLGGEDILDRFLSPVKKFMHERTIYITSYFKSIGEEFDPKSIAPHYGLKLSREKKFMADIGFQKGPFAIYEFQKTKH